MGNPEENEVVPAQGRTSKMPPAAAPTAEESRLRAEAMDAALDITATTTKLKAKEVVKIATKNRDKAQQNYEEAHTAFKDALYRVACEVAHQLPVVAAVQQLGKVLANCDLTPAEVFGDIRVFNQGRNTVALDLDSDERHTFTVAAYPIVDINFRRVKDKVSTSYTGDKVSTEFSIADDADMLELYDAWVAANKADNEAIKELAAAIERQNNIPDQVDVARVQLQRGKLESMGTTGEAVLERVTTMLEAADGDKFLDML